MGLVCSYMGLEHTVAVLVRPAYCWVCGVRDRGSNGRSDKFVIA